MFKILMVMSRAVASFAVFIAWGLVRMSPPTESGKVAKKRKPPPHRILMSRAGLEEDRKDFQAITGCKTGEEFIRKEIEKRL